MADGKKGPATSVWNTAKKPGAAGPFPSARSAARKEQTVSDLFTGIRLVSFGTTAYCAFNSNCTALYSPEAEGMQIPAFIRALPLKHLPSSSR